MQKVSSNRLFAAATAVKLGFFLPGGVTELDADLCGVGLLLAHGGLTAAERRAEIAALTERRDAFLAEQMTPAMDANAYDEDGAVIGRRGYRLCRDWEGAVHGTAA